jgi:hypothetical protein
MYKLFFCELKVKDPLILIITLVCFCSCCVLYITYKYRCRYRIETIYQPVTIEHHIYRIPIEDRTDLAIEDKHNVHNMCLKRNALNVIQDLSASDQNIYTIESAFSCIRELIEFSPDPNLEKLENAENTLALIEEMNTSYHNGSITEKELIRLIWERINHPVNINQQTQLKDNLIEQLADCVNTNGSDSKGLHCCEGRIMRLLQTLECCDSQEIVNLRPMWAYKEEIANKLIRYRQKLLDKSPPLYTELEQKLDLTNKERCLLEAFNKCLIKNLNKRFKIDYLSQGLLSSNELKDITKPYYDSLMNE